MKEMTGRDEEDNDDKTVSQTRPLSHHPSLHTHPRSPVSTLARPHTIPPCTYARMPMH